MFGFSQAIRSVETRVGPQHNGFVLSQAFPWFGTSNYWAEQTSRLRDQCDAMDEWGSLV